MNHVFAGTLFAILAAGSASEVWAADEILKDKCSAEVAIVASYDARPESANSIILKRGSNGKTPWTPAFTVRLSSGGHIRWWCRSTTGNMIDVGTWRIEDVFVGTKCDLASEGTPTCRPDAAFKIGSSAWNGWTPERSRCANKSTSIRARLDNDRRLSIQCLGK